LVNRAVEAFGRLDIMCTNAGILRDRTLWKMSDDDFDAVIETHLRGTFTCGRAAAVRMREQGEGGSIVLVSSIAGQRGNFGQTNYAAAKAGIAAYARTWAMELAKSNITVNAIVPNAITRMIASIPGMGPLVEQAERGEPLPDMIRKGMGMGLPTDVAPLLVFLASDAARDVTGQCIGLGGDKLSLWSHPQEVRMAYRDGGWTADAIAEVWKSSVGQQLESYGIPFLGGN
jgi:NAD(P)-dependent dehydrogenase (short-subunit alcohol dehydrogenase family)